MFFLKNSNSCSNFLCRCVAHSMGLVVKVERIRDVFGKHGCMKGPPGKITLKPEAVPHCVTTARIIPFALMPKIESELKHMEDEGILTKVTEPTDLCAPIATAFKKNGDVRLCVDLKKLTNCLTGTLYAS